MPEVLAWAVVVCIVYSGRWFASALLIERQWSCSGHYTNPSLVTVDCCINAWWSVLAILTVNTGLISYLVDFDIVLG